MFVGRRMGGRDTTTQQDAHPFEPPSFADSQIRYRPWPASRSLLGATWLQRGASVEALAGVLVASPVVAAQWRALVASVHVQVQRVIASDARLTTQRLSLLQAVASVRDTLLIKDGLQATLMKWLQAINKDVQDE